MKNKELLLSIIIPVYNTELYLEECVESILKQNLENYEILFINDGSIDNSQAIMLDYQEKYPFIRYFEQENAGQGAARNVGLRQASGRYIYFMDSDDYLIEGKLREVLFTAKNKKVEAIFFDGESFEHDSPQTVIEAFNYKRKKEYGAYSTAEELMHDLSVADEFIISPCLYLVKKEVYERGHLMFPEGHIHEDEFFTATLFLYAQDVYHTNEVVFRRRVRQASTVTNKDKTPSFLGYVNVLPYFDKVYTEHPFQTKNGQAAYRKKMKQLVKSAYVAYSQVEDKESVQRAYTYLESFRKKKQFFGLSTYLFLLITKYPKIYKTYQKMKGVIH